MVDNMVQHNSINIFNVKRRKSGFNQYCSTIWSLFSTKYLVQEFYHLPTILIKVVMDMEGVTMMTTAEGTDMMTMVDMTTMDMVGMTTMDTEEGTMTTVMADMMITTVDTTITTVEVTMIITVEVMTITTVEAMGMTIMVVATGMTIMGMEDTTRRRGALT